MTVTDYWVNTNSPTNMLFGKKSYQTPERDAYIIETQMIDPTMIAADLKMPVSHVKAYRRLLGIKRDNDL